ncbi:MAG: hypothetical protein ACOZNI_29250 [Myxococcota bacterium]
MTVVVGVVALFAFLGWVAWSATRPRAHEFSDRIARAVLAGEPDPYAPLARVEDPRDRAEALAVVAQRLRMEERDDLAREATARAAREHPAMWYGAWCVEVDDTDRDAAIAWGRDVLKREPLLVAVRTSLATLLAEADRAEEALDVLDRWGRDDVQLEACRASVLALLDRPREAVELADAIVAQLGARSPHALTPEERHALESAARIGDNLRPSLLGSEANTRAAYLQGRIDPSSGVNLKLLGESLMASATQSPWARPLGTVPADEDEADRLLGRDPDDVRGLCLRGLCALRLGRTAAARAAFERARERDPGFFPAALGLGAAMTHGEVRAWSALGDLPWAPVPAEWAPLFPELAALTAEERRVVFASVAPLRGMVPRLLEAGVVARVLPLGARPTDVPELEAFDRFRTPDLRAIRAIGGLATPRVAVSRIEDLLDTCSEDGWVFAHELAHVAFFHLPEAPREQIEALYRRALATPWACGLYQLSNVDEFFAVAYAGWLQGVYGRPHAPVRDAAGVVDAVAAWFEAFAGREAV